MKKKSLIVLALLFPSLVKADDDLKSTMFNPEYTAVTSQSIAPDARGGSLGDTGAATDADVNSQYWNVAKYPFCISRAGVALSYTPWLRSLVNDIYLGYLAGYYRLGEYAALSASLRYFSLGQVYMSSSDNMSINPYEMSLDVGASLMLSEKFSLGVAVRWIYSDLTYDYTSDTSPGSAFAADLGFYYQSYPRIGSRECQLGLGLNFSNIGSKIRFGGVDYSEFIPANLRLGASLTIPIDEYNKIMLTADANKYLVPTIPQKESDESDADYQARLQEYREMSSITGIFKSFTDAPGGFSEELREIRLSGGAEYTYNDKFSIRAGYHHQDATKGNLKYFTVGAGFKMSVFALDVNYLIATANTNPLDKTLRFSLSFDMDGIKDLFKR